MQYQFIERQEFIKTIEFFNSSPLLNIQKITYFNEEGISGVFLNKEFRYSFDNAVWTNWNTLTQNNLSSINFNDNPNFWLQIRYTRAGISSGNIQRFYLFFESTVITPPVPAPTLTDADLLQGEPGLFYLDRVNQIGPYVGLTIKNIEDNNPLTSGVYFSRTDGSLGSTFFFKKIKGKSGIIIEDVSDGLITLNLDASIAGGASHGKNIGLGDASLYYGNDENILLIKTIKAGNGISLSNYDTSTIQIDVSGVSNSSGTSSKSFQLNKDASGVILKDSSGNLSILLSDNSTYSNLNVGKIFISSPNLSSLATPYALVIDSLGSNIEVKYKQLGTMAFEASSNYYIKTQTDIFINTINSSIGWLNANKIGNSDNGLSVVGTTVKLGGTLIDPITTIIVDSSHLLQILGLDISAIDNPYAFVSDAIDGKLKLKQLGPLAFESSASFISKEDLDASLADIWNQFSFIDISLNDLGLKNYYQDISINSIWTKLGLVDISFNILDIINSNQDSSISLLNNWNENQDISIFNIANSQSNYVKKSGDIITGPIIISNGGLAVTNGDVSIFNGSMFIAGNTIIGGSLTIDGSMISTNIQSLDISTVFINLNTGLSGTPPAFLQSGFVIERGSQEPFILVYNESDKAFRIGISHLETSTRYSDSSTQILLTRENTPTPWGIGFWNPNSFRLDTGLGFEFDPSQGLKLPIAIDQSTSNLVLTLSGGLVGSRTLGSMAFETSTNYYGKSQADLISYTINSSINIINYKNFSQDSSLIEVRAYLVDLSINKLRNVYSVTGIAGGHDVYSTTSNNIAYIKKIVAGSGASITSDASIITISVSGAAGYVSKYTNVFNGTSSTSLLVSAAMHGLGIGPFSVTVYDGDELVHPGINCAANGDVTITWSNGTLGTSCKYLIMG
jgi:hypothetical protein